MVAHNLFDVSLFYDEKERVILPQEVRDTMHREKCSVLRAIRFTYNIDPESLANLIGVHVDEYLYNEGRWAIEHKYYENLGLSRHHTNLNVSQYYDNYESECRDEDEEEEEEASDEEYYGDDDNY